jgi:hypothetical protein
VVTLIVVVLAVVMAMPPIWTLFLSSIERGSAFDADFRVVSILSAAF